MTKEYPFGESRSELFARVLAHIPRFSPAPSGEVDTPAVYVERVLVPFIEREMRAAMVQEGIAKVEPLTQEAADSG